MGNGIVDVLENVVLKTYRQRKTSRWPMPKTSFEVYCMAEEILIRKKLYNGDHSAERFRRIWNDIPGTNVEKDDVYILRGLSARGRAAINVSGNRMACYHRVGDTLFLRSFSGLDWRNRPTREVMFYELVMDVDVQIVEVENTACQAPTVIPLI